MYKRLTKTISSRTPFHALLLLFAIFLQTACSEKESPPNSTNDKLIQSEANNPAIAEHATAGNKGTVKPAYIDTGDLPSIQSRSTLRLIAPLFDGADALPRKGFTVQGYQALAEKFARSLGLTVQWVYVKKFSDLIPTLNRGEGDIIVTNLTATRLRSEQVEFTRPISQIDEVLITRLLPELDVNHQPQHITVSIAEGTAYIETLMEIKDENLDYQLVSSELSDSDLLTGIVKGTYEATVIDSDIANQLMPDFPQLKQHSILKKHRRVGWAVRKNNSELLRTLNEFLVAHHIRESYNSNEKLSWQAIKERERLRVLTLNNPASYFMYRGELMGFDYDLIAQFAKEHDLHLSVIVKNSISELFDALKNGEADVIAASITQSDARSKQGVRFTRPYLKVKEQLIGRESGPGITKVEELAGLTVGVNPATVFYQRLQDYIATGIAIELIELPEASTEELISRMLDSEFDFTIADSHLVAIEMAHREGIKVNIEWDGADIAWVLRPEQTSLNEQLDAFIKREYRGLLYNLTFNKYFKSPRNARKLQAGRVGGNEKTLLSPFDHLVQTAAKKYDMDWRLIVSQMYQESKFDPTVKSFAGAMGLMQVMPRTAKEMGYDDLYSPENGIKAGVSYLDWTEKRFPGSLNFESRIYFTLAAYNAGAGHVRDARRLAKKLGKSPDKWFNNVEDAMLLLSQAKYYKQSRFGYVRGREPVNYVKTIRDRYLGYLDAGF